MLNEYQFTPSELIQLFVDGETDAAQQAYLFSRLAADVELQEEFRAASLIRRTLENVRGTAMPPAEYTTELFAKAGFATTAGRQAGSAFGISPGTVKSIVLALFSAAAGTLLTLLIVSPDLQSRHVTATGRVNTVSSQAASSDAPRVSNARPGSAIRKTPEPLQNVSISSGAVNRRLVAREYSPVNTDVRNSEPLLTDNRDEHPEIIPPHAESERITNALIQDQSQPFGFALQQDIPVAEPIENPEFTIPDSTSSESTSITLYLQGVYGLEWYPIRDIPSSDITENLSIGGVYSLSPHHAVGVELGRELLPMYSFADGAQKLERLVSWVSGVYCYRLSANTSANTFDPFARIGLGITGFGPMGKAVVGVQLHTGTPVSAAVGIEGLSLLYRRGTTLHTTSKIGAVVSVEVRF